MVCLCISFIIKVNKLIIQTTFFACTVYSLNNSSDIFFLFFELGSVDELRKLLSNKDVYQQFLSSHDEVKIQNNVNDDLCKENLQLADENLRKEPRVVELRNQYKIICTTELAVAQEKLNELEKQKEEMLKLNSPLYLLQWIQEAMNNTEEESENLHQQVLDREIDLGAFLQKYKKLRTAYHRKSLIHLAARTSNI
ncbi:vacuolar protein-sorting-associated protein 37 homolog 1 isoform X1 [Glycine max]|uniref:vacuolar protein-sorting-associated protein 37 homolog 1 isoform X1 n=1 Tax=Glycine max TaxID=3847 RepID=UPI001B356038|nr:vacuolar protein-sorting-associated protein 37 homolog 1 isoform X1 [Glycine max]